MRRRRGFLAISPWRFKISQTVERCGQDQRGCRLYKIDNSFLLPQLG